MPFFLITFLISVGAIFLSWTRLASTPIGITNIFQCIRKTAAETLKGQGLSIFAFAFFLHAILQSQAFQSLFAAKKKWLEKKKYFTIGLITIVAALLSSNLSWFDEFVHFYPLVIPLLLAMGFNVFSSILCLYGGSIAGLMGLISGERIKTHFERSFGNAKEGINYTGTTGIGFRLLAFVLFTTIVILFNIWYCSRNKNNDISQKDNLTKAPAPPPFNRTRKIILAVAGLFLLGSIFAQVPWFAKKINESKLPEKISSKISSQYEEEEDKYEKMGRLGTEMNFAKENENKKNYWGTFGDWEEMAIDCWLIIGAIIICWLAKQNVMSTLITAVQSAVPLVLVYIFAAVPAGILMDSGVSNSLAAKLLPANVVATAKYWALLPIFAISVLLSFFISSSALLTGLVATLATTLVSISNPVLIYAAIFAWVGGIIGMAFSPNNGILIASLEQSKTTYKQFINKTWILWASLLTTALGLILFWTKFSIK